MARTTNAHILRKYHTAARSQYRLMLPALLIPLIAYGWFALRYEAVEEPDPPEVVETPLEQEEPGSDPNGQPEDPSGQEADSSSGFGPPLTVRAVGQTLQLAIDRTNWKDVTAASLCGFLLLFPLWAKLRAKFFSRYFVTLDSVIEEHGLLSRKSSEIRIRDIRNMVVEQTLVDRIFGVGTLFFSSSAGSHVEVRFINVSRPRRVGDLVRAIQSKLGDGVLSPQEIADLSAQAGKTPPTRPPPNAEPTRPPPSAEPTPTKRAVDLDSAESEVYSARGNTQTGLGAISASGGSSAVTESPSAETANRGAETTQGSLAAEADEEETRDELYRLLAEQEEEGESDA